MDMPRPNDAHRQLQRLVGRWEGEETIAPSPFEPGGGTTTGTIHDPMGAGGLARARDGAPWFPFMRASCTRAD